MSSKRILKLLIAIVITSIILIIIILFIRKLENNSKSNSSNWIDTTVNNDGDYSEAEDLKYDELEKVTDVDDFATVYTFIKDYISYSQDNNEIKSNINEEKSRGGNVRRRGFIGSGIPPQGAGI